MPPTSRPENFPLRLEGGFAADFYLLGARIEETIGALSETVIEFVCTDRTVDLEPLLGSELTVVHEIEPGRVREFPGTCVSVEFLGAPEGVAHYRAILRPWLWFLTRTRNNRIFQQMTVVEIVQQILGDHGMSADLKNRLNGTYPTREYTVQYGESDLDFLNRLTQEEGIYIFFLVEDGREKMVLGDGAGSHDPIDGGPIDFVAMDRRGSRVMRDHVFEWRTGLAATSGKLTLYDYNFETPRARIQGASAMPMGRHSGSDHELYGHPGRFRESGIGDQRARVRMEAEAARHHTVGGAATTPMLEVGKTFELAEHPRETENTDWMVTRTVHVIRLRDGDMAPPGEGKPIGQGLGGEIWGEEDGRDAHRVLFEAVPKSVPYRAPLVTPWPEIAGVHTAVVTGPAGEEIHTDSYGRIKLQFHWDRYGRNDEHSTCWARCMMPWTGSSWGIMAVPRIGQEVVVHFEEGNPDRPLVIGMLYNADTMPPWTLPANKTQSGVKTNSSKNGGGFNELMMDDRKSSELVRFQAERDYRQIVKNDAEITVGLEHKDKGDMKMTVHRHLTETLKTGDHAFTIEAGSQTIKVKKDLTETVEGKQTETVTGNVTRTVKQGNVSDRVEMGNIDVKVDLGKITIEAMQSIELKVGGSSIKIDQMGVTIKGAMSAKMEGGMTAEVKGPMSATLKSDLQTEVSGLMTNVKGTAMLVLKGGVTMIN